VISPNDKRARTRCAQKSPKKNFDLTVKVKRDGLIRPSEKSKLLFYKLPQEFLLENPKKKCYRRGFSVNHHRMIKQKIRGAS
jgi:hypothetical protein